MPKKLKFAQKGYENYSGPIGKFTFVDGVSTEVIHRVDRDQLSAAFQFVEIDDDGNEIPAGVAHRLVSDSAARAVDTGPLKRQTEEERLVEETMLQATKGANSSAVLHTRAELEAIAEKGGLKGLRSEVADKWGVRGRSITLLIEDILVAQAKALEGRQLKIAPAGEDPAKVEIEPVKSTVETGSDDAALAAAAEAAAKAAEEAAASGDMGAALNQMLLGSSTLDAVYNVAGRAVSLGTIVSDAHARSGLDVEAWNALDEAARDVLLNEQLALYTETSETADADEPAAEEPANEAADQEPANDDAPAGDTDGNQDGVADQSEGQ